MFSVCYLLVEQRATKVMGFWLICKFLKKYHCLFELRPLCYKNQEPRIRSQDLFVVGEEKRGKREERKESGLVCYENQKLELFEIYGMLFGF